MIRADPTVSNIDSAERMLMHGPERYGPEYFKNPQSVLQNKMISRWGQSPNTPMLDDFPQLLNLLFSEEASVSSQHRQNHRNNPHLVDIPEKKLDRVKQIWEAVLPARRLSTTGQKLQVFNVSTGQNAYNGSEMSDGERVIFYLAGQAMACPQDTILVIDEPELHIHKSIQFTLWQQIMCARPDCLFVLITHDLDFACGLSDAKKIWVKEYDGKFWHWDVIDPSDDIPEPLRLQILGSRRTVLLVEGVQNGADVAFYRIIYPQMTVIPVGGCSQVIAYVRAFRAALKIHGATVHGLIDRDYRSTAELDRIEVDGIKALPVAEYENLFLLPDVLKLLKNHFGRSDDDVKKVLELLESKICNDMDRQVALHAEREVKNFLDTFKVKSNTDLRNQITEHIAEQPLEVVFDKHRTAIQSAVDTRDYQEILRLFNQKGLAKQLGGNLGQTDMPKTILGLISGEDAQKWTTLFRGIMPKFD